jgi:hypothetical protein
MPSHTLLFSTMISGRYLFQGQAVMEKVNALTLKVEGFAGFRVLELQILDFVIFF